MIFYRIFVVSFLSLFSACVTASKDYKEQTVDQVDLPRFMGKWYVIASIPTIFEKNATNAVETYTLKRDGTIDVDFRYHKNTVDGPLKVMTQQAFVIDKETNAYWKIRPLWPFLFDYLVIDLESKDYSYTVIGRPNKQNLWIMAREPSLSEKVYNSILTKVEAMGYDLNAIIKVPQKWD